MDTFQQAERAGGQGIRAAGALAMIAAALGLCACAGPGVFGGGGEAAAAPVQYEYFDSIGNYSVQLHITPDGAATLREVRGPAAADTRELDRRLTSDEMRAIRHDFAGWDSLKTAYALDVNPQYHVSYGGHTVVSSNPEHAPPAFGKAASDLWGIAAGMLKSSGPAASAPAAGPAAGAPGGAR